MNQPGQFSLKAQWPTAIPSGSENNVQAASHTATIGGNTCSRVPARIASNGNPINIRLAEQPSPVGINVILPFLERRLPQAGNP